MQIKKPHLFFAIHYLELGGAEISLIGLLQAMDYTKYNVDLFIYSHHGELMRYIPKEVNLLPEIKAYAYIERPMKEALSNGLFRVVWGRLKAKWQYRQYVRRKHPKDGNAIFQYVMNNVEPYLPSLDHLGEYDLAVSFLMPHNIVLNKILAKRKVCWIHTDYTQIDVNATLELPVWNGFDKIVSISSDVTKAFLNVFPSLNSKMVEIHNILSDDFVRSRAEEMSSEEIEREMPHEKGFVNLLSIGRFTYPKNYDNVPAILSLLNVQCYWYLIGYGGDESLIRQRIAEAGMEGRVVMLGKKENPYPYIKACDIYVQPSRYEGNSVTVREAQMLGKPVVVTNYPTATSQIQDDVDGVIVPLDNQGCAEGIARFVQDKERRHYIVANLQTHDYSNAREIEKFYQLI